MVPRIVVLTLFCDYAERILLGLATRGILPEAILVPLPIDATPAGPPSSGGRAARATIRNRSPRRAAAALLRRTLRALDPPQPTGGPPEHPWQSLARKIVYPGVLNGPAMASTLRALEPDYLVLGDCGLRGILTAESLAVPRVGTINAHPALLPGVRGTGSVERALERGVAAGVTAHFVDPGIDTGALIRRELVPVHSIDTVRSIRRKARVRSADVIAEIVAAAARGEVPAGVPQRQRFAYSRWPSAEEMARIEEDVRGGLAVRLYEEWREFFGGDLLPPETEAWPELRAGAAESGAVS